MAGQEKGRHRRSFCIHCHGREGMLCIRELPYSWDSDFLPALQIAQSEGVHITLYYSDSNDEIRPHDELLDLVDDRKVIDAEFLHSIRREWEGDCLQLLFPKGAFFRFQPPVWEMPPQHCTNFSLQLWGPQQWTFRVFNGVSLWRSVAVSLFPVELCKQH